MKNITLLVAVLLATLVISLVPGWTFEVYSQESPTFPSGYMLAMKAEDQSGLSASFCTDYDTYMSLPIGQPYHVIVRPRNIPNIKKVWLLISRPAGSGNQFHYETTRVELNGYDSWVDGKKDTWQGVITPELLGNGTVEIDIHFQGKFKANTFLYLFRWAGKGHIAHQFTFHGAVPGLELEGLDPRTRHLLQFNTQHGWIRDELGPGMVMPSTAQPTTTQPPPKPTTESANAGSTELQAMEEQTEPTPESPAGIYLLDGNQETLVKEGSVRFCTRNVELVARFPKDTKTLVVTFKDKDGNQDVYDDEAPDGPGVEFITLKPEVAAGIYQLAVQAGNTTHTVYLKVVN